MKNITILFLTLISTQTFSQLPEKINENNYFSLNSQYLYNSFVDGVIHFKNGTKTECKINYNVINGEFHYLDKNILKTFSESDMQKILKVTLESKQFLINDLKIYEIIKTDILSILLKRIPQENSSNESSGASYGVNSNTSNTKKLNSLSHKIEQSITSDQIVNIKDEQNILEIEIKESLKILYNNRIYPMNKKSFYQIFSDHKEAVKYFIKKNNVKLNDTNDITNLINFCKSLEKSN